MTQANSDLGQELINVERERCVWERAEVRVGREERGICKSAKQICSS